MTIPVTAFIFGAILLLLSIVGDGLRIGGHEFPSRTKPVRILLAILGIIFILTGLVLYIGYPFPSRTDSKHIESTEPLQPQPNTPVQKNEEFQPRNPVPIEKKDGIRYPKFIEKPSITHINDLPVSHSINIHNRHFTAKGAVVTSERIDDLYVTLYIKPSDNAIIYKQYVEDQVLQWKQLSDNRWKGEWENGGYIGEEGMHYDMEFKVWAVAVNRDKIKNLENVFGSITEIRNQLPHAVWSEPIIIIKKR